MNAIAHIYSYFDDKSSERRNAVARATWGATYRQGGWVPCPVMDDTLPRMFNEGTRRLPYIKDLIGEGLKMPGDYICLTNADTCFAPLLHSKFVDLVRAGQLAWGTRRDFKIIDSPLTQEQVLAGGSYPGLDVFLFPKRWWLAQEERFPDMLLGREGWDAVLSNVMHQSGGAYVKDLIYHEKHRSTWEQSGNRYSLPGQLHNILLATAWFRAHGLDPRKCGLREVPPQLPKPLPTTQETPPGGWRVNYCGFSATSHSFEIVARALKDALRNSGTAIPTNLPEIIIRQSYGM